LRQVYSFVLDRERIRRTQKKERKKRKKKASGFPKFKVVRQNKRDPIIFRGFLWSVYLRWHGRIKAAPRMASIVLGLA
jgi:hypothetical protein